MAMWSIKMKNEIDIEDSLSDAMTLLITSHPDDKTGFYSLARMFQSYLYSQNDECADFAFMHKDRIQEHFKHAIKQHKIHRAAVLKQLRNKR